jgi:steroid 5-alpha reductase family enzyme
VWTLQGLGVVEGSVMTGVPVWAIVGPIVAVAGLILVVTGVRLRARAKRDKEAPHP